MSWVLRDEVRVGQEKKEEDSRQQEEQVQKFDDIKTLGGFRPGRTEGDTTLVVSKV